MKKLILLCFVAFYTYLPTYSQTKKEIRFGGGIMVGNSPSGGFEFLMDFVKNRDNKYDKGITLGLGISLPMTSKTMGDDYTGIVVSGEYKSDIYEKGIMKDPGFYFIAAYRFGRIILGSRIGAYSLSDYENGYNNIMKLYYVTSNTQDRILYGGFIEGRITKIISVNIGYDKYNEASAGINFRF